MKKEEFLEHNKELFYILGAMLGDGCIYEWRGQHQVWIHGEKEFIEKCAERLSICLKKKVKGYYSKSYFRRFGGDLWFIHTKHKKLFYLFKKVRKDLDHVSNLMAKENHKENSINFIEGFFDAEGCVKIIKEKVRKTPKICLDICSTFYEYQELVRKLLMEHLDIEARYSIQVPKKHWRGHNKKIVYHLRIYRKAFIRRFFENMSTIKLKGDKPQHLEKWLNNGKQKLF